MAIAVHSRKVVSPMIVNSPPMRKRSFSSVVALVFGVLMGMLLSTGSRSLEALRDADPYPRGYMQDALWVQGLSHVAFHQTAAKARLANLVRQHGSVGVVGVEWGSEVLALAKAGFEVHAFEPMQKYHDMVRAAAKVQNLTKVHLYNVAAASVAKQRTSVTYRTDRARVAGEVESARIDSLVDSELDVLSVDIQGAELDAIRGASRLMEQHKVSSLWVEIFPCNIRVKSLLHMLDDLGYVVFDFVPWGLRKQDGTAKRSMHEHSDAAQMGFISRPARFDDYWQWMCDLRATQFTWVQTDVLAIRRELITPQLMLRIASLSNDLYVQSIETATR